MPTYRTLVRRCERYALIGHANRRWYRVARAVLVQLQDALPYSRRYLDRWSYERLCDIVAITSPRCSVKRNLRHAWREFTGKPQAGDMIRSTRIALEHYYETGEIRGPKTSRFAKVLRGDDDIVVVDTWMARALGVADNQARNKSTQELAERVINSVRYRMSRQHLTRDNVPLWALAETQAAVWAGMIRTHYDKGKIPLFRVADALDIPF